VSSGGRRHETTHPVSQRLAGSSTYPSVLPTCSPAICPLGFDVTDSSTAMEVRMTAARGGRARIARLQRSLGKLDVAVLSSLDQLRLLATDHLQRLHMATGSLATRSRRTRALLRRLTDLGLVARLPREIGGRQAGSGKGTFCLTRLGQAMLVSPGVATRRRMVWQTKPYFQDHMLAVAELYVGLVEACRARHADLIGFRAEPSCWRRFSGLGGETVVLKPDAAVRVGIGDYELANFVEVDLGTESLPTIKRKCLAYAAYWRSGLDQQRHGLFPRVLWLVPNEHRADGIASVVQHLADDARDIFTVALLKDGPDLLTRLPDRPISAGATA
jgi:protein involved in plasmid replication-relaxation